MNQSVKARCARIAVFGFLAVIAVVFFACSSKKSTTPKANSSQSITIGYLPIAAALPLYVATEKGYFQEKGFEPELVRFGSSNELASAGTAGHVNVMMALALNAAFDVGSVSGKKHSLFGVNIYSDQKPHVVDYFVARIGSEIRTLKDVRGKRIGAFPGSVTRIFVENILRKEGVKPSEYTYLELAPKDWEPALQSRSIDAASVMEPQFSQIVADKAASVVVEGFFAKLMADVPLSGNWLAADFVQTNSTDTAQRLVAVYDKAVDFIRKDPETAKSYYPKYTGVRPEILPSVQINIWRKSTEIAVNAIQQYGDMLYEHKGIQQKPDAREFIHSPR